MNLQFNALQVCKEFFVKIEKRFLCKKNALENTGSLTAATIFEFTSVYGCVNCVTYNGEQFCMPEYGKALCGSWIQQFS